MSDKGECIRTLGRFRPFNAREIALQGGGGGSNAHVMTLGEDGRSVSLGPDKSGGQFTLDAMLGPDSSQQDVYDQISGIVDSVLQGYNGTLLAYGQTGSGKTHSVIGSVDSDAEAGLLPRAVRHIFEGIVANESCVEFSVSCSYLEIYKEVVRDLLQPAATDCKTTGGLQIREDVKAGGKGVYVEGLAQVYVMGEADVLECLACGNANRVVGATMMNAQSSRSVRHPARARRSGRQSRASRCRLRLTPRVSQRGAACAPHAHAAAEAARRLDQGVQAQRGRPRRLREGELRPAPPKHHRPRARRCAHASFPRPTATPALHRLRVRVRWARRARAARRSTRPRRSTRRSRRSARSSARSRRGSRTCHTATRS